MRSRQTPKRKIRPVPRVWLMTDERLGDGLLDIVRRLPRGAGIVFRHYSLAPSARRRLFWRVRQIARSRQIVLLLSGSKNEASAWGADGNYGSGGASAVHNAQELIAARRSGADILFISPVFVTSSHPGAKPLGIPGFRRLAAQSGKAKAIALGGMDAQRARTLGRGFAHGWAAIDAFMR